MITITRPRCAKAHSLCWKGCFKKSSIFIIQLLVIVVLTQVSVCKAQNQPPRFLHELPNKEIIVTLKEGPSTPVGILICSLRGDDPERERLTFGIKDEPGSDIIRIEQFSKNEAKVVLNKLLDRETKSEYNILLTLTDGHLSKEHYVTQSLLIIVEDVNDNAPIFKQHPTSLMVREDAKPRILMEVEATDLDEGFHAQVSYDLEELGGASDVFSVQTVDGIGTIRLIKRLDYESKSQYHLKVLAKDHNFGGNVNTGTTEIVINVIDINDQPPEFISSTFFRVSENVNIGTTILQVRAVDGDKGINNLVSYSILERSTRHLFDINATTGEVFTIAKLDREAPNNEDGFFILNIMATEFSDGMFDKSATTELTIMIMDENDETPTFRSSSYVAEINENAPQKTPVTFTYNSVPEVFDHDLGYNGSFTLTIREDDDIFEVSPEQGINEVAFQIRVRDPTKLDYEKKKEINFTLIATEVVQDRPKQREVRVSVRLRDQNDNYPQFGKIVEVTVPENCLVNTFVALVHATDIDSGYFGTKGIEYTNLSGSLAHALSLDKKTGVITVKHPGAAFDRELVSRHYLTVEARDDRGQGNRNTAQLIVNIRDVNDNPPIFLQDKYVAVMYENNRDFEVPLAVKAFDTDQPNTINSETYYFLLPSEYSEYFKIDPKRGIVTANKPLDFESLENKSLNGGSTKVIVLTIRAMDMGQPKLYSDATLTVYFNDVNDNLPEFESKYYNASVKEDIKGGAIVLQLKAHDKDLTWPNNKVLYQIQSGAEGKFIIEPETGTIRVATGSSLDPDFTYPKTTKYVLKVLAVNGGFEVQHSTLAQVTVNVIDVNNKPPVFIDPGIAFIKENIGEGTYVHRVQARDPDENYSLYYNIDEKSSEARNEDGLMIHRGEYDYLAALHLDANNGLITLIRLLDREKVKTMKLGLLVEDRAAVTGAQTATATLEIIVEDENDNDPTFSRSIYESNVTENSKIGVPIVNVVADDADENRTITYTFEKPGSLVELVSIDSKTGKITVAGKIDREVYPWLNMTVRATDSGVPPRYSMVDVRIKVIDENDNNPRFISNITSVTVLENTPINAEVTVIKAIDLDYGDYGKVTYLMRNYSAMISESVKFAIHPDNGSIILIDKLNWETDRLHTLHIEAWDNYRSTLADSESRKAFLSIQVNVIDVNDHAPKIDLPEKCINISEFHDVEDNIFSITAEDKDNPELPNGQTILQIIDGTGFGNFSLHQTSYWTADLRAMNSLRGKVGNYTLRLEVQDYGQPPKKTHADLTVCVTDVNDNPPVFVRPDHRSKIFILENETVGSEIIHVQANDADYGLNGEVRYRIERDKAGHYSAFEIDEETGMIFLKKRLNRTVQKLYEIQVEAYDLGSPTHLSSNMDIIFYVRQANKFEPRFKKTIWNVNFTEELPAGREIALLPEAVDEIEINEYGEPPPTICYFIIGGNVEQKFKLDKLNHTLTTTEKLDREKKEIYELIVKATEDCYVTHAEQKFHEMDSTLLKVVVTVTDVNDKAPKFINKVFTGGITEDSNFGTEFMHIKAIDEDSGTNAIVKYYLISKVQMTLSDGFEDIDLQPFLIDASTGAVTLNFDPQPGMKGYFDFSVVANDTDGLNDTAKVFIYIVREDQRVRFVLRQHPSEIRSKIEYFREVLSNATGAIVNVDEYRVHEGQGGSVDRTRTDLYLHLVRPQDNSIYEVSEILQLIDRNVESLDGLFKEFNVLDTQPAKPQSMALSKQASATLGLSVLSGLLAMLLAVSILFLVWQRTSYERQLKAANANPFDPEFLKGPGQLPNTNKHCAEGSNPIWIRAEESEWFKTEDSVSVHNSLDENAVMNDDTTSQLEQSIVNEERKDNNDRVRSIFSVDSITIDTNGENDGSVIYENAMPILRSHSQVLNNPLVQRNHETTEL